MIQVVYVKTRDNQGLKLNYYGNVMCDIPIVGGSTLIIEEINLHIMCVWFNIGC